MSYYNKYMKYKKKYIALKEKKANMMGGKADEEKNGENYDDTGCNGYTFPDYAEGKISHEEWAKCWDEKEKAREKELEHKTNTNSYVPRTSLTSEDKIYYTHWNDGRPFKVKANSNRIWIGVLNEKFVDQVLEKQEEMMKKIKEDQNIQEHPNVIHIDCERYPEYCDLDKIENYQYDSVTTIENFEGYWWGFDSSSSKMHGNSILVKINDHKYVFIGMHVLEFETDDVILDHISTLGNNDIPYSISIGYEYLYFLSQRIPVMIRKVDLKKPLTIGNSYLYSWELYADAQSPTKKLYDKFGLKNVKILQECTIC